MATAFLSSLGRDICFFCKDGGAGRRRNVSAGQPFLEVEQGSQFGADPALADVVPVQAINAGAQMLEAALSRLLFPLR